MNKNKLPKDWKHINLGSIAKVKGGKRLPKGHTYSTEVTDSPYIRVTDFGNQTISFEKLKYLNVDTQKAIKNYTISSEDVYISIAGTIGVTGIIPQKLNGANLTENAAKITELIDCDKKFLSRYLSSLDGQSQIKESTKTTTQPKLSLYRIAEIIIPLPPPEIQNAIVSKIEELFSDLDKGIEDLKTAQQQLKTYRQSVLKYAFEGKLTNKKVKDGVLPKGWFWRKFGDVVNNFDGKRRPLSRNVRATRKGEFRYYGATEIVDYIDDFIFDGKYLLIGEDGANLVSKSRALAFIVEGKFWVNNHAHIVQTKDILNIDYLSYYFNSLNLAEYVTGTAQPKLNQANMNKIPIPISNIDEQGKIVEELESRLSVADKMEESIAQSLLQAEALRQSILKKAFSGVLV
jgi:type I restriction enzyme S subunit